MPLHSYTHACVRARACAFSFKRNSIARMDWPKLNNLTRAEIPHLEIIELPKGKSGNDAAAAAAMTAGKFIRLWECKLQGELTQ